MTCGNCPQTFSKPLAHVVASQGPCEYDEDFRNPTDAAPCFWGSGLGVQDVRIRVQG